MIIVMVLMVMVMVMVIVMISINLVKSFLIYCIFNEFNSNIYGLLKNDILYSKGKYRYGYGYDYRYGFDG